MKAIYSFWGVIVNGLLILLPLAVLVTFMVQFGQPLVGLYQDYFFGNPVRELSSTSRTLVREPGEIPFRQLERQFDGVRTVGNTSDIDTGTLRGSVIRIHRAVINRLGSGNIGAVHEVYSDSYTRLLEHPLIDQIFGRPDLVRDRLIGDVTRIGRLPTLPSHPARGLDTFWDSADTAAQLIETYGEIYANQVSCRRILNVDCGRVYDPSAKLTAQYLAQYLRNWPRFSRTLEETTGRFLERIGSLYNRFVKFDNHLAGYLRGEPWQGSTTLNQAYENFKSRYLTQLRDWYGGVVRSVDLSVEDFSSRQWKPDFTSLNGLRKIERRLDKRSSLRDLLLSKKNVSRRKSLLENLGNLYVRVAARHHFDPKFEASDQGITLLVRTMEVLPGGETLSSRVQQRMKKARSLHRQLRTALGQRSYGRMLEALTSLEENLSDTGLKHPWEILARQFLADSRKRITNPEWQPTSGKQPKAYRGIIRRYGKLGRRLGISALNKTWVNRTLLALKSRRFNQLKHDIKKRVSTLENNTNLEETIRRLKEIQSLQDFPDTLASQVPTIVFQSAVLEYLQVNRTRLKDEFSSVIESDARFRSRWNQVLELVGALRSGDGPTVGISKKLTEYVKRWKKWLEPVNRSTEYGKLVRERSISVLRDHLESLLDELKDRIRRANGNSDSPSQLLTDLRKLSSALEVGSSIRGYDLTYDLDPWKNVLRVRRELARIRDTASNLTKGSLWERNKVYERYRNLIREFDWQSFPSRYDARVERQQLREVSRLIMNRSREIFRDASEDWLPGWGGRVMPVDVLDPWLRFLRKLRERSTHSGVTSTVKELLESTETFRRELTGNSD